MVTAVLQVRLHWSYAANTARSTLEHGSLQSPPTKPAFQLELIDGPLVLRRLLLRLCTIGHLTIDSVALVMLEGCLRVVSRLSSDCPEWLVTSAGAGDNVSGDRSTGGAEGEAGMERLEQV